MSDTSLNFPESLEEQYEVLETLAASPLKIVYKIRERASGDLRLLKVMRAHHIDDENLQLRFHREARVAMRLRHPRIVPYHDFQISEGRACLIKDFVEGRTLADLIREDGPPEISLAVEIALQSLEALDYVHQAGYSHRDVAPTNLMLTDGPEDHPADKPYVMLVDLGIAKRVGGFDDLTGRGRFVGQARYSAPEQFREAETDPRSDLYSFGVVLYELLTGSHPVHGDTFADHFMGHVTRPPRDFSETDPGDRIPLGLRQVVLRSLEKNPDNRILTAQEFSRLLEPYRDLEQAED